MKDGVNSPSLLDNMKSSVLLSSSCGKVKLTLLGLMSDEADMFRDGKFKVKSQSLDVMYITDLFYYYTSYL
jgi:hypothetical protein